MARDYCRACGLKKTVWVKLNSDSLCESCAAAQGQQRNELYAKCKYNSRITVSGNSLNVLNRGKETVVPISNIQEFQLEPPQNYGHGIIRIKTARAANTSLNIGFGISMHNASIELYPEENAEFVQAKRIRDYISNYSQGGVTNTTPQPASAADEIRKFQQLLNDGIITQEEFEQKKKQLLGI